MCVKTQWLILEQRFIVVYKLKTASIVSEMKQTLFFFFTEVFGF